MHLGKFDVKTTSLYGNLDDDKLDDIHIKQSEGFADGNDRVCKLLKKAYMD